MPPFSLNNFHIMRTNNAAFFHTLANSNINANFSNVTLETRNSLGATVGILSIFMRNYNAIVLEIDNAIIHANEPGSPSIIGGVIANAQSNSYGSIVFKIKEQLIIKVEKKQSTRHFIIYSHW